MAATASTNAGANLVNDHCNLITFFLLIRSLIIRELISCWLVLSFNFVSHIVNCCLIEQQRIEDLLVLYYSGHHHI